MQRDTKTFVSILVLVAVSAWIIALLVALWPLLQELLHKNDSSQLLGTITGYGMHALPLLIALQILTLFIPFLPTALVEMLIGLLYGTWLGSLISTIGFITGNMLVFFIARQCSRFILPKKHHKRTHNNRRLSSIHSMTHPEYATFLFYLLPGLPKSILPYLFARSRISSKKYLISVSLASLPSILLCTWMGHRLSTGDYLSVGVATLAILLAMSGILYNREYILSKIAQLSSRHK